MKTRLVSTLKRFYEEEQQLLKDGLCERTLVFRIGHHLINEFQEYSVYSEYNRAHSGDRVDYKSIPEKIHTFPDIVIFSRDDNDNNPNKIIIEAKKKNNKDWVWDKKKLHYFTSMDYQYRYRLGCHLIMDKKAFYMVFYQCGNPVSFEKHAFRNNNQWQDKSVLFSPNYTYEAYTTLDDLERELDANRGNS